MLIWPNLHQPLAHARGTVSGAARLVIYTTETYFAFTSHTASKPKLNSNCIRNQKGSA